MPIAKNTGDIASPTHKVTLPQIQPENYKSVVVDDKYVPLNSLIAYVDGAPWAVNYYMQILGADNETRDLDPAQSPALQQYSRIAGLELRVDSPLASGQDQESAQMNVTGSALLYPFITPNVGDLFIANILGGGDGLFRVSDIERKVYGRDSVYIINYSLVDYVNNIESRLTDLEKKVVKKYTFDKTRLIEGFNPTVTDENHSLLVDFSLMFKDVCAYYFRTFFNRETSTLIIPNKEMVAYDSFVVKYILKIVDTFDADHVRKVKNIDVEQDYYLEQPQFWSVLRDRDFTQIANCHQKMGLTSVFGFSRLPTISGLRISGIDYLIYPEVSENDRVACNDPLPKTLDLSSLLPETTSGTDITSLLQGQYIQENKSTPLIPKIGEDTFYVFTKKFYQNDGTMTILEGLTVDYLKRKPLNLNKLSKLVESYRTWGKLEQFYYLPIVLTLMKVAPEGIY